MTNQDPAEARGGNGTETQTQANDQPSINLPKGGGAIRGIGEKFTANSVMGTGSLSVPIAVSPSRSGFAPQLQLNYNSGAGNGPFGLGWSLGLPQIARKTDKGLPRYRDQNSPDTFIFSGAEDLIPVLVQNGNDWVTEVLPSRNVNGANYEVQRYRPRIEGSFARIERWSNTADSTDTFWRSIGPNNTKAWYGMTPESRIADPSDPSRIFAWLICQTCDDKGNAIVYQYVGENSDGLDLSEANEVNRTQLSRTANRYLKSVKYGNQFSTLKTATEVPPLGPDFSKTTWLFELVFDYDEGYYSEDPPDANGNIVAHATPAPAGSWSARQDPFSTNRATFEIRSYRLCRRTLMFHHFPSSASQAGYDGLVRSTEFEYEETPTSSFISSVSQSGYILQTNAPAPAAYSKKALPSVQFEYSLSPLDDRPGNPFQDNFELQDIDPASLENLPVGLDNARFKWLDLDGEGISGMLSEEAGNWFYKPNLGNARFGPSKTARVKPSFQAVAEQRPRFLDLSGDGRIDLVEFGGPTPGLFERSEAFHWNPFKPFHSLPNLAWSDPNLQFVDLTGDGLADILITEGDTIRWCASLADLGFGPINRLDVPPDEDRGPRLLMADGTTSIFLADMTGDGLADLVRIRYSEVCYWPNRGYGHFGAKIVMDNVPCFDHSDQFDGQRIRLADTDGSGTTDIIYLGSRGVGIWLNQSGNSLSTPRFISCLPRIDDLSSVFVVDLLGSGTACIVFSTPLPGSRALIMRYVDLMQGQKPHLLVKVVNNFGAETGITYTPSTQFYLADKMAGTPWATRLPFPVHCVSRIVAHDYLRETVFTTSYTYHHGYYDGVEREFRGFGRVEQLDTQDYTSFKVNDSANVVEETLHQPPVLTKAWHHTGVFFGFNERVLHQFNREYFQNQQLPEPVLPESQLPSGLTGEEYIEAYRALKGLTLRQEIYALDGAANQNIPYSVSSITCQINLIQPRSANPYASFLVTPSESLGCHYERNAADPRTTQAFTLETDEYGFVTKAAVVAYARQVSPAGLPAEVQTAQARIYVVYSETDYTNDVATDDEYRLRVAYEKRSFELTGLTPDANGYLNLNDIVTAASGAAIIPFETPATSGLQKRLISQTRTLFLNDNLSAPLPLRTLDSLGLVQRTYQKAFTSGLASAQFGTDVTDVMFAAAGYVHSDGDNDWWIPSGVVVYASDAASRFYLPDGFIDPLGTVSTVERDVYDFLVERLTDALGNQTKADNDYRTLAPWQVTDLNQNRSAVATDELGVVVKAAVMGKAGANEGDSLDDPTSRIEYDLFNWINQQKPAFVHAFNREQHGPSNPRWQESYVYFDGSGGVIMTKTQAEPGLAKQWNETTQQVEDVDTTPNVRWVGNGRTIVNNKGSPVKQYEPYFSVTSDYESTKELVETGVTPILYYDPLGRNIRVELPNGTLTRVEFDSWSQTRFDANDTTLESQWYANRGSPDPNGPEPADPEQRAAWLAAKDANTPGVTHSDTLGRTIYAIADNGPGDKRVTRSESDLTGHIVSVLDNRNRLVTHGVTNMIGSPIYAESAERGKRWTFLDVLGKPVKLWDYAGRVFSAAFDKLHRPVSIFYQEGNNNPVLFNQILYGEMASNAADSNLLGKPCLLYDQAGVAALLGFDFKGNLLQAERRFTTAYQTLIDWSALQNLASAAAVQAAAESQLEQETYSSSSQFDALNRPIQTTLPDGTILKPTFNEANYPSAITAQIRGQGNFITFLAGQDYDAKGQRQFAKFGNSVITQYTYDPETFRLTNLLTRLATASTTQSLQDLTYVYDPVGNITQISDDAQPTNYFRNAVVQPKNLFQYDALYQLIKATGREQASTGASPQPDNTDILFNDLPHPNDLNAVRLYTELYAYDDLGNILSMQHVANGGSWTRYYHYQYQDDPTNVTNRLSTSSLPGDPPAGPFSAKYTHDPDGRMTAMPQVASLVWNFLDQLQSVNLGGGGMAYYVYGPSGQRMRKIIQRNGATRTERRYLGPVEIYREYTSNTLTLERWTTHISDNTGRIARVDTKTVDTGNTDTAPLNVGVVRYQYGNHLGSAILETDDQGVPISYEEYHPFGTTAYHSAQPGANHSLKRYRFSGKERDDETGLYYFGARYYAAWLGRWTSADPIGVQAGINLYRYCSNNPLIFHDPNGTDDKPLNSAGQVSWEIPSWVFRNKTGQRLSDAEATANFGRWMSSSHPDKSYTPGSVTIDWSSMSNKRGPTFNAEWLNDKGQPVLPREGEFGSVTPMRRQPPAEYSDPADKSTRLTENEHATPRAQNAAVDPDYDQNAYRGDATVRSPRGVSLDKTRQDNSSSASIQQKVAAGQPVDVTEEIDMPSNANFQRANEAAKAAGQPSISNPGSINRGTLEQTGGRFERGKDSSLPQGSVIEEPIIEESNPAPTPSVGVTARNFAGNFGSGFARTFIPGFAEAEIGAISAPYVVASLGISNAAVNTLAVTVAAAPTVTASVVVASAAGGYLVGGLVGHTVENASGSKTAGVAAGTLSGAATGAAVGAAIGFVFGGIGAGPGAVIGGIIGGIAGFIGSFW